MKSVFVDASFSIASLSRRDRHHHFAGEWFATNPDRPLLTTAWVINEVADSFRLPHERRAVVSLLGKLRLRRNFTFVEAESELFWRGFDLYRRRLDKEWSLTDCISMVVMAEHDLTEILTNDHHFEQAGFTILMP